MESKYGFLGWIDGSHINEFFVVSSEHMDAINEIGYLKRFVEDPGDEVFETIGYMSEFRNEGKLRLFLNDVSYWELIHIDMYLENYHSNEAKVIISNGIKKHKLKLFLDE